MKFPTLLTLAALSVPSFAMAADVAASAPTLTVSASVQQTVSPDVMRVAFAVERSGPDLGRLNRQVLEQTNQALAVAKAPGIDASLENMFTQPQYDNGKRQGWTVRAQVVIEGKDFPQVAALSAKLSNQLEVSSVSFNLSNALREKTQEGLRQSLGKAFQQKADSMARALGYSHAQIRSVSLEEADTPVFMERAAPMRAMAVDMPMPTEAAKETVTIRMSGTVELLK